MLQSLISSQAYYVNRPAKFNSFDFHHIKIPTSLFKFLDLNSVGTFSAQTFQLHFEFDASIIHQPLLMKFRDIFLFKSSFLMLEKSKWKSSCETQFIRFFFENVYIIAKFLDSRFLTHWHFLQRILAVIPEIFFSMNYNFQC